MELFGLIGWISVPNYVLQFVNLPAESLRALIENELLYWWITLGVGTGLYLIGLIFGGIGLMQLAKRAGIKHGWMGFIPFANTYLTGKIAGDAYIFNSKIKRIGLWAMLCEIFFVLTNVLAVVLNMLVLDVSFYTETVQSSGTVVYTLSGELMPESMQWIYTVLRYYILDIINYVFSLVVLFMFFALFNAFFRKYYARNPFMMTFLSAVLPGRGFAIFAVRNNTPVDYNAYMYRRMQQQQQQQQQYGYPGGGYYGPNGGTQQGGYYGPNGGAPQGGSPYPHDEPFGDDFGAAPPSGTPGTGNPAPPPANPAPPADDDPFSDF